MLALNQDATDALEAGPACEARDEPVAMPPAVDLDDPSAPARAFGILAEPDDCFATMARFPMSASVIPLSVDGEHAFAITTVT